ncbi:hypothetical protein RRG08_061147 [Elysia crispata]|uniref:Uncharacterized protein n=1 Tax=Elysia crispata TaxID=231223 RepID=A0AAE0XDD3_9GAST|nr:hypothetical protein RRG08_061147 [Elysia crispata]
MDTEVRNSSVLSYASMVTGAGGIQYIFTPLLQITQDKQNRDILAMDSRTDSGQELEISILSCWAIPASSVRAVAAVPSFSRGRAAFSSRGGSLRDSFITQSELWPRYHRSLESGFQQQRREPQRQFYHSVRAVAAVPSFSRGRAAFSSRGGSLRDSFITQSELWPRYHRSLEVERLSAAEEEPQRQFYPSVRAVAAVPSFSRGRAAFSSRGGSLRDSFIPQSELWPRYHRSLEVERLSAAEEGASETVLSLSPSCGRVRAVAAVPSFSRGRAAFSSRGGSLRDSFITQSELWPRYHRSLESGFQQQRRKPQRQFYPSVRAVAAVPSFSRGRAAFSSRGGSLRDSFITQSELWPRYHRSLESGFQQQRRKPQRQFYHSVRAVAAVPSFSRGRAAFSSRGGSLRDSFITQSELWPRYHRSLESGFQQQRREPQRQFYPSVRAVAAVPSFSRGRAASSSRGGSLRDSFITQSELWPRYHRSLESGFQQQRREPQRQFYPSVRAVAAVPSFSRGRAAFSSRGGSLRDSFITQSELWPRYHRSLESGFQQQRREPQRQFYPSVRAVAAVPSFSRGRAAFSSRGGSLRDSFITQSELWPRYHRSLEVERLSAAEEGASETVLSLSPSCGRGTIVL